MLYGTLKRLVSYRFVHILLSFTDFLTWQKLTQKFVILMVNFCSRFRLKLITYEHTEILLVRNHL